jgi:hypothetical protein
VQFERGIDQLSPGHIVLPREWLSPKYHSLENQPRIFEAPELGGERHVLGRLLPLLSPQKGAPSDFAMIAEEIPLIHP